MPATTSAQLIGADVIGTDVIGTDVVGTVDFDGVATDLTLAVLNTLVVGGAAPMRARVVVRFVTGAFGFAASAWTLSVKWKALTQLARVYSAVSILDGPVSLRLPQTSGSRWARILLLFDCNCGRVCARATQRRTSWQYFWHCSW
jgi:hypothetical protein